MSIHLHLYYSNWTNESRAIRSANLAFESGFASHILFLGHHDFNLPSKEKFSKFITIIRFKLLPNSYKKRIIRILSLPLWYIKCLLHSSQKDISLIVSHSLASLPIAVILSKICSTPLVYDAHELETERNGWSPFICSIASLVERLLFSYVDHTLVVNNSIKEYYQNKYPFRKITTIRNIPDNIILENRSELKRRLNLNSNNLLFLYCGNVVREGRMLDTYLEVFTRLEDPFVLLILGDGKDWNYYESRTKYIKNIILQKAVPQEKLVNYISGADIGLCIFDTSSLSYFYSLPNKIFEYAQARLIIFVGPGKELKNFGTTHPATFVLESIDSNSLFHYFSSWNHDKVTYNKKLLKNYTPPFWQQEQIKLNLVFTSLLIKD